MLYCTENLKLKLGNTAASVAARPGLGHRRSSIVQKLRFVSSAAYRFSNVYQIPPAKAPTAPIMILCVRGVRWNHTSVINKPMTRLDTFKRVRDGRDKGQRHQGKEIVQWVEENQFHAKILEREKIAESGPSLDELIRRQTEQSQ